MKVFKKLSEWREYRRNLPDAKIGFVPTMGALHEGHISLIRRCCRENEITVASIFVNPTQFNDKNDLKNYPRTYERDHEMLEKSGTDCLFYPTQEEMYSDNFNYRVVENNVSKVLCGLSRPGHFEGVMTVVLKLFNIVKPRRTYFGEKDYQQLMLIKEMAESFFLDIEVIGCPIVRESSGLAMSSRNERLSEEGRKKASVLYKLLSEKREKSEINKSLEAEGFQVDYLEDLFGRRFAAVILENVRLIDNVQL
ncbi:MAG: pantoate--beta-alanine ligase [Candidatus Riflebacteria bacterium]|nr:pantoate--beta-alanine ligase [Candidatus Riflebacteria bacterium]